MARIIGMFFRRPASEGISLLYLHNVGKWILISSCQILFWYELIPTTFGPQKSEKIKVLKSKLWILLFINRSQIEILSTFLGIPWFSFQKMFSFCNFQKFCFQKMALNCMIGAKNDFLHLSYKLRSFF